MNTFLPFVLIAVAEGQTNLTKLKPFADGKWYDLPKDFNMAVTICESVATLGINCPAGWVNFANSCYLLIDRTSTFSEATSRCKDHSGKLVSIGSTDENEFVRGKCGSRMCWMGLTKRPGTLIWEWPDGSQASYTNWAADEPSDENTESRSEGGQLGVSERAAVLHFSFGYLNRAEKKNWANGQWLDVPAGYDEPHPLCERPVTAEGCHGDWEGFGNSCYKLFTVHSNYAKAVKACQEVSGHLVTISSSYEQNFVHQLCGKNMCWLGLHEHRGTETWVWADQTNLTYENWYPGEPNNYYYYSEGDDENVAMMNVRIHWQFEDPDKAPQFPDWVDGTWYDAPKSFNLPKPICEHAKVTHECELGWVSWRESCYLLIDKRTTYRQAVELCDDHMSRLVSIESVSVNVFIQQLCGKNICWLGLQEDPHSETWRWSDGTEPALYTNWHPGEPNNYFGVDEKVAMMHFSWGAIDRTLDSNWAQGKWFDVPATFDQPAGICEQHRGAAGCSAGWLQFGESCYRVLRSGSSYGDAKKRCQGVAAHLASVRDQNEQDFVQRLCDRRMCWLGLQEHSQTEAWYWIDGSPKAFANWAPGEPNNAGGNTDENACVMNFNFQWAIHDAGAWDKQTKTSTSLRTATSTMSSLQTKSSTSLQTTSSTSGDNLLVVLAFYVLVYVAIRFTMVKFDVKAPEELVVVGVSLMVAFLALCTGGGIVGTGSFSIQICLLFLYTIVGFFGVAYLHKNLRRQRLLEPPPISEDREDFDTSLVHETTRVMPVE